MTHTFSTHWFRGLTVVLAALLALIGLAAHGSAGAVTLLGAAAVVASVVVAGRIRVAAAVLLVVGALGPLTLTWWSVVTPVLAVLCLLLGWPRARTGSGVLRPSRGDPVGGGRGPGAGDEVPG